MKTVYPVIFTPTEDTYLIEVPDLDILTEGVDIENAIEMARDAISVTIVSLEDNHQDIPKPSSIKDIDVSKGTFANEGKGFISVVDIDTNMYRMMVDTKPVERKISLPSWLDYQVSKSGIDVSYLVQEALINKLNIQHK